ncbi:Mitochondrial distribution and morphology protein 10 [Gaertneriomyces sp. JEL0708]|nr:Mitochondrial distribution and morphology protein 10 [Gaertneriomyces sp. JEL0708]
MLDFMEYCLRRYYAQSNFSPEGQYSALLLDSRRILEFRVPSTFSVTVGKSISPELKGTYTVGIPNVRSVGFLFTSVPMDLPKMGLGDETGMDDMRLFGNAGNVGPKDMQPTENASMSKEKAYLLYGRLFEDFRLEALYSKALSRRTHFVTAGTNSWDTRKHGSSSSINAQLMHATPNYSTEVSYTTDEHVIGLSGLQRFGGSNWAAGGELYYTAKERSGGLSFAARYKSQVDNTKTVLAVVSNPMMGQLSASYTTTVAPNLTMSTRYDFNVYSYEADLAVGVEYAPKEQRQLVKGRISLSQGMAVKLEGQYKRAMFSIGLMTEFLRNPRRSVGVELQIS